MSISELVDKLVSDYNGKVNVSFDGIAGNAGQCVQLAGFYIRDYLHKPILYRNAYYLKEMATAYPADWQWIENSTTAVPQKGDLVLWLPSLPNSGNAGHVATCVLPKPGTGTFISFDTNWGGKYCHLVTHDYSYVAGWLRPIYATPAQPTPQPQGDEMIANQDQATRIYRMLRPNGGASQDELTMTAGKRTYASFLDGAQTEINQRDANLRSQAQQLADMSGTINSQNQTISQNIATIDSLNAQLRDANLTNDQKQQALQDALVKLDANNTELAKTNSALATAHDMVKDLQDKLGSAFTLPADSPSWLVKFLAALFPKKS